MRSGNGVAGGGGWWIAPDGTVPAAPGAYGLEIVLPAPVPVAIGGRRAVVPAGRWRYFGSAHGPGGLRARVRRHLDPAGRRDRWHVDRLTRVAPVVRVLLVPDGSECALVAAHLAAGWTAPVPGFGSSDCRRCPAHLLLAPAAALSSAGR